MTVEQVINQLSKHPKNMEVYMKQVNDEFPNAPVEMIEVRTINFDDGVNPKAASYECVVITDEI